MGKTTIAGQSAYSEAVDGVWGVLRDTASRISVPHLALVGWVLPQVAIIDRFGLNDKVVARSPTSTPPKRKMAHERRPPSGYVDCFQPNVRVLHATTKKGKKNRYPRGGKSS